MSRLAPAPPTARNSRLALTHPAMLLAVLAAAACVLATVTFELQETDFWQHLLVGKAIWQLHRAPTLELWTWPTYGQIDTASSYSWGFRVLLWPCWNLGGVWGLFAWRWVTTLATFALLWATGRQLGARGFAVLLVFVLCSLTYRQRTQIRPETLVGVLMALEIWILETRRSGGADRTPWLIAIQWIWANVHISYYLGFLLIAAHLLDAHLAARRVRAGAPAGATAADPRRLWLIILASAAISFVNPYGWRALAQPFQFFLFWRNEAIFQTIGELSPVNWRNNARDGLPLLLALWPALALWRWPKRGFDLVEALFCVYFTALALSAQRFLGPYILVGAPLIARDFDEWVRTRTWPRWSAGAWRRAALTVATAFAMVIPELSRPDVKPGVGIEMQLYPVRACDFMASHGVRGRGFNHFEIGGYMLWRFWPDRERLPFIDIHQAGTRIDRYLYAMAMQHAEAWHALDQRYAFDYALLRHFDFPGQHLLDVLDADSTWAPVFNDDAATLYVRRHGRLATVADSFAYHELPGGKLMLGPLGARCERDSVLRSRVRLELLREVSASSWNATARSLLANIAMIEGRWPEARSELAQALATDPTVQHAHERLGMIALSEGRAREALHEFELEARTRESRAGLDFRLGQAWQALGDARRARAAYQRELRLDPGHQEARDSLSLLDEPTRR